MGRICRTALDSADRRDSPYPPPPSSLLSPPQTVYEPRPSPPIVRCAGRRAPALSESPAAVRTSWPRVFAIYACGVGAGLQFAKVSVLFDALKTHYAAGATLTGWFVSAVGLVGIVFGATAGLIVARIGFRQTLIFALASRRGYLVGRSDACRRLRCSSRCGRLKARRISASLSRRRPALLASQAPRERPLALGLWGTFMSVAFLIAGLVGRPLVGAFGLSAPFLAHAAAMAALALSRVARRARDDARLGRARAASSGSMSTLRGPALGIPALCWLAYTGMYLAMQTLTPELAPPEMRSQMIVGMASSASALR